MKNCCASVAFCSKRSVQESKEVKRDIHGRAYSLTGMSAMPGIFKFVNSREWRRYYQMRTGQKKVRKSLFQTELCGRCLLKLLILDM